MTTNPDDLDAIIRAALDEEEPQVTEAEIQAALVDPALTAILARAIEPYEGRLTPKGLERMRRTVAIVFLTDPTAASLLARVNEPRDASAAAPTGNALARRRRRTP